MRLGETEFDIGTPIPEWGEGWDKVKIGGRTNIFFKTSPVVFPERDSSATVES